ncbi:MAG TPA: methyltransferase domain-containing protein [Planctomycetaceae bacterium]|nr:methyltransferase domain-containing protein [Planctomycetaceae bacterium]HQZ64939.1 methyltransferase domain-containing protein [Planctomycetaceae bacterium]
MSNDSESPVNERPCKSDDAAGSSVLLRLERIDCPLCGSPDSSVVQTSRDNLCGIPGEFAIERCGKCGHRFMNPRPVLECLGDCYPYQYGPHQIATATTQPAVAKDQRTSGPDVSGAAERPLYLQILPLRYVPGLRRFYNWLMDDRSQPVPVASMPGRRAGRPEQGISGDSNKPRALELGCATGQYLLRLQNAGWNASGIEPGQRPAAMAKDAGLDVHCGTLETCELLPESFDLAAAWMVIEHVPDPRNTLRTLHQFLKPGGTLLFSIPNVGCWEPKVFGRYWYVWELPRHLHHFTTKSIRTLLEQCKFTDIKIVHQRNLSNVIGSLALTLLARWPDSRVGRWLLRYPDRPTFMLKLFLAPMAHVLAWLGQGGRLTISARRPPQPAPARSEAARMQP